MIDKSTLRYSLLGTGLLILMAGMVWGTSQLHDTLIKGRLEQVAKDWEQIRVGIIVYGVDFCGMYFPSDTQRQWKKNPKTPLTFGTLDQTTSYSGHSVYWCGLTTPVAYMKKGSLYDPFRDGEQMYGYTCWTLHHQGGPTGYRPREFRATAESIQVIAPEQAFAWNPSITGTKSEDTVLAREPAPLVLTVSMEWPVISAGPPGARFERPDILVK